MKAIVLFSNRDRVGKTTLTCNLASYFARQGKKVVLVDADPQCDSTVYCFNDELFNTVYYEKKGFTIYDVIKPVNHGMEYVRDVNTYFLDSFGFEFIAGDPRLALCEGTFAADWSSTLSGEERGIRTTLTFSNLIRRFNQYDFVIFDMGSSLGAINRAILLGCDYFITPMSSDLFSILSIENTGKIIKRWRDSFREGFSKCRDEELKQYFASIPAIQFLGYVTQQYTSKTVEGARRPVQAYKRSLSNVPEVIQKKLINVLNVQRNDINYELGTIPNFSSIIPLSQSAHKPIFELNSTDGIVGAHFAKVKDYKGVMESIATRFIDNMEKMQ